MSRVKSGKAYEEFNCRVPPGLTTRIREHAALHSQRVRDVVAEALLAYLDGTHVAPLETPAAQVIRRAQQRITEGLKMLGNVVPAPRRTSAARPVPPQPDGTPAYDTEKYHLGKLCPQGHKWNGMDSSLRTNKGSKCLECEKEGKKRRLEEKRASAASR